MTTALPPQLEPVAGLLGTWHGHGEGVYLGIEPFEYDETLVFGHWGRPVLSYSQETAAAGDGSPLHRESGFLRLGEGGRAELVVAQHTGIAEVSEGRFAGGRLDLTATGILHSATATATVTAIERHYSLSAAELSYELAMATTVKPLAVHLRATLRRVG